MLISGNANVASCKKINFDSDSKRLVGANHPHLVATLCLSFGTETYWSSRLLICSSPSTAQKFYVCTSHFKSEVVRSYHPIDWIFCYLSPLKFDGGTNPWQPRKFIFDPSYGKLGSRKSECVTTQFQLLVDATQLMPHLLFEKVSKYQKKMVVRKPKKISIYIHIHRLRYLNH